MTLIGAEKPLHANGRSTYITSVSVAVQFLAYTAICTFSAAIPTCLVTQVQVLHDRNPKGSSLFGLAILPVNKFGTAETSFVLRAITDLLLLANHERGGRLNLLMRQS